MAGGSTRRCTLLLAPGQRCKGSGALLPRAGGLPAAASGSGCRMSCWLAAGAIRSVASTAGPANARAETCLTSSAPGPGSRAQQVNVGLRDRRPGGGGGWPREAPAACMGRCACIGTGLPPIVIVLRDSYHIECTYCGHAGPGPVPARLGCCSPRSWPSRRMACMPAA